MPETPGFQERVWPENSTEHMIDMENVSAVLGGAADELEQAGLKEDAQAVREAIADMSAQIRNHQEKAAMLTPEFKLSDRQGYDRLLHVKVNMTPHTPINGSAMEIAPHGEENHLVERHISDKAKEMLLQKVGILSKGQTLADILANWRSMKLEEKSEAGQRAQTMFTEEDFNCHFNPPTMPGTVITLGKSRFPLGKSNHEVTIGLMPTDTYRYKTLEEK